MSDRNGSRQVRALAYASDVGVLGLLRGLSRLRGLILLPIIGRGLGAAAYGAWTQSLVAVAIGTTIVLLQLDAALVRFGSGTDDRTEQRDVFLPMLFVVLGLGTAIAVAALIFARPLATVVLGDAQFEPIARWLGIWTALTAVGQLATQLQRGLLRVKLSGVLSTIETLGQLAIVAALILIKGDLLVAVWGAVAWELVFVIAVLILGFRSVGISRPRFDSLRTSLNFSLPLVPSYYSGIVLSYADRLIIAAQLGAEAVGVYAAAYSLARIIGEMSIPIRAALFPAVSRAWDRGDKQQARWLLSNTLLYYMLVAVPAVAGLSLLGPQTLGILSAGTFEQGIAPIIAFLGTAYVFSCAESTFAIVLQLVQDTKAMAVARGVAAIVYVPLVLLAVTRWGLLGGACVTALSYGLDMGLTYRFAWRHDRFAIPLRHSAKAVVAALGMSALVWNVSRPGLGGLAMSFVVGFVAYWVLLIILGGVGKKELRFIGSFFGNRAADSG